MVVDRYKESDSNDSSEDELLEMASYSAHYEKKSKKKIIRAKEQISPSPSILC